MSFENLIVNIFFRLQVGFVTSAKESKNYAITRVDMELYQHGEFGQPPTDYAFTFWAGTLTKSRNLKIYTNYFVYFRRR